ncbi:MAG TPA: DinB family protein [Chitinophagaceae bacterium]|nr:DinB family protein [Chitinophagaceae bacterium]
MLKRTKGRILLTLLVMTGLAGTLNDSSISSSERKLSVNLMKDTKAELIKSLKGLSETQLDFRPGADKWSVKECVYHIATTEKVFTQMLEKAMKAPANPEKRTEIKFSDTQLIQMMQDRSMKVKTNEMLEPKSTGFKTFEEALDDFKASRAGNLKYIKSTTEDLRNHVLELGRMGSIDCYQLTLIMGAHSNRHTQQIREVKNDPGFPRK